MILLHVMVSVISSLLIPSHLIPPLYLIPPHLISPHLLSLSLSTSTRQKTSRLFLLMPRTVRGRWECTREARSRQTPVSVLSPPLLHLLPPLLFPLLFFFLLILLFPLFLPLLFLLRRSDLYCIAALPWLPFCS